MWHQRSVARRVSMIAAEKQATGSVDRRMIKVP
jgi:hypothetical protein